MDARIRSLLHAGAALALLLAAASTHANDIVPRPALIAQRDGTFTLDDRTRIVAPDAESRRIAELLHEYLFDQHGLRLEIATKPLDGRKSIVLARAGSGDLPEEGYRLSVEPDAIRVTGKPAGLFYGVQTLTQLLPPGPAPCRGWRSTRFGFGRC